MPNSIVATDLIMNSVIGAELMGNYVISSTKSVAANEILNMASEFTVATTALIFSNLVKIQELVDVSIKEAPRSALKVVLKAMLNKQPIDVLI